MKALFFSPDYWRSRSESRFHALSLAAYMLPDSFPKWAGVTVLVFAASWAGIALGQAASAGADILWPANGLLLAFLLRMAPRNWFAYLAGSVIANIAAHQIYAFPLYQVLLFSAANVVEISLAAGLLAQKSKGSLDLTELADLGRFGFFGVVLAPLCSTVFVEAVEAGLGHHPRGSLVPLLDYFIGDAMGIAIMTPLFLAMEWPELSELFSKTRRVETASILLAMAGFSLLVFTQRELAFVFLLFSALLFVVFRLGSSGGAIGVFLMAAPAIYLTAVRKGPFVPSPTASITHSLFLLQSFLGIALVTVYLVSASLRGRERHTDAMTAAYREADANAGIDHVTGLANRRTFDRKLAQEWRRAVRDKTSLSLLMIDVDYFKLYNDHYGHLAGDECLRIIGSVFRSAPLRETDLAARYGGEEFAVILPRATAEGAFFLADRIRQTIADCHIPHLPHPASIVTVSMGVASIRPSEEWTPATLIERADQALYQSKKDGRNLVRTWERLEP